MMTERQALFDTVCQLAKQEDKAAIVKILAEAKLGIDFEQDSCSPTGWLAQQGEHQAVNFLITELAANLYYVLRGYARANDIEHVNALMTDTASRVFASEGYAWSGNESRVNQLIAMGSNINHVVWGYARGNHVALVNALIAAGASKNFAACGYAAANNVEQVNWLVAQGARPASVIKSYAQHRHVEQVNGMLMQGTVKEQGINQARALEGYALDRNIEQVNLLLAQLGVVDPRQGDPRADAWRGYNNGGHLDQPEKLQYLMTLTFDEAMLTRLSQGVENGSAQTLLRRAGGIRRLMTENHMNYSWAERWSPALTILLQQGALLLQHTKLNLDMVLYIASFISGFEVKETADFLNRYRQAPVGRCNPLGKHTLFLREATLLTNNPVSEIFITKAALAECLAAYQPSATTASFFVADEPLMITELKALLAIASENISYQAILVATASERDPAMDAERPVAIKNLLQALTAKCDESLVQQLSVDGVKETVLANI